MATKSKLGLHVLMMFLLSVLVVALAKEDPELMQCQHQCRAQQQFDQTQIHACVEKCEDYYAHKKRIQEERGEPYEWKRRQGDQNPYVFQADDFDTKLKSEHGSILALPKFSSLSKFLRGVEKYRLGLLVIQPLRFLTPNHLDAHALFVVISGRGRFNFIHKNEKKGFELEKGVVFRLPAGTTHYIANTHNRQPLHIAQLLQTINDHANFQPFIWASGNNPESFLNTFSSEVLEASLKVSREDLQSVLGGEEEKQRVFVKASREQIRSMSETEEEEGTRIWPFRRRTSKKIHKILENLVHSNKFGQLYEVDRLEDFANVTISYAKIAPNGMTAPSFNSESTKIALVIGGKGKIEVVCPHVASSESGVSYERISAQLSNGTVFVVPAGHPVAVMSSSSEDNLEIVCFDINSGDNVRYFLAGKNNVVKQMEGAAKELTFSGREKQVDKVFGQQDEEIFVAGPQQEGRAFE